MPKPCRDCDEPIMLAQMPNEGKRIVALTPEPCNCKGCAGYVITKHDASGLAQARYSTEPGKGHHHFHYCGGF